ncbi:hypothetical protein HNQ56_000568 [Anaerotaenia torta]|uniref:hypothetical protein n=1 Tax=Anaerotaenia torta TaxID=433293 RepID=UPI003D21CF4C
MEKKENPIFKDTLTPEEQAKQDALLRKKGTETSKIQTILDAADAVTTIIDMIAAAVSGTEKNVKCLTLII